MNITCPNCGGEYDYIGVHWARSCGFPDMDEWYRDVFTGLLMGDAWVNEPSEASSNVRCNLDVAMTNRTFLEWLSDELSPYVTKCKFYKSAEAVAKSAAAAGMNASAEHTNDQYVLKSRAHPFFNELREWYSSGEKVFPADVELTPTKVKYWYVCDGMVRFNDGNWFGKGSVNVAIAASNEMENFDRLLAKFNKVGFDPVAAGHKIRFSAHETPKFLDWIGNPVPGFRHKWMIGSEEIYRKMKSEEYNE